MASRQDLRNPNFWTLVAAEADRIVKAAKAGQAVKRTDAEARMATARAEWRALQPKHVSDRVSDHELNERLASDVTRAIMHESRAAVQAAQAETEQARAVYREMETELRRIPEPSAGLTADEAALSTTSERAMLLALRTVINQNARIEARQRVSEIKGARELVAALKRFEADGDTFAAIEADAALDRALAVGPASPSISDLTEYEYIKSSVVPQMRDARLTESDRARLAEARTSLDQLDAEVRQAVDIQSAIEHVGTLALAD